MEIDVKGLDELAKNLAALHVKIDDAAVMALRGEAEIEMTEAKQRTPVWNPANPVPPGHQPGSLRASGHVVSRDDGMSVSLVFGGSAADYAIYVHEDLDAHHATGQAKFLESVLLESAPYLAQRIADRIKRTIGS